MQNNSYMNKLQAQWEQLQAEWQKKTAEAKEAAADKDIEMKMNEMKAQFDSAGEMAQDKLDEWGSSFEKQMNDLNKKMKSM
jgi:hypothetical protein